MSEMKSSKTTEPLKMNLQFFGDDDPAPELQLEPTLAPVPEPKPEPPNPKPKVVTKETYDKATSELAEWKRKYNAKLTDDELKAAQDTELQEELNTLRQERAVSKLVIDLAKNGIEDSEKIAEQFIKGETGEAVKNLLKSKDKIISDLNKEIETLKLQKMGDPALRQPDNGTNKSISELMEEANLHPERLDTILKQIDELNKTKK